MVDTPTPNVSIDIGPLDWRVGIVDRAGRPTPEFQRRWNSQRSNNSLIGVTIGHGAPTGVPAKDGLLYIDEDTDPVTEYVSISGAWEQVGVTEFTQLADVPHAYTSQGGKAVRVAGAEDALEFATISALLDEIGNTRGSILYRGASGWVILAPGTASNVLTTHGAGADPTWDPGSVVAAFTDLTDVPHTYAGSGGKLVRVNGPATGLDFISLSSELDTISSTQGSLLYRNNTGWVALTPGTAGQVLQTGGAGANPSWGSGSSTGASFFAEGLLLSNELLGEWAFSRSVVIDQTNTNTFFTLAIAPTADTDLPLDVGGVSIGHIHFAAAALTGSLVITSNPYTLTAHSRLRLVAPASADTTAADYYGFIAAT